MYKRKFTPSQYRSQRKYAKYSKRRYRIPGVLSGTKTYDFVRTVSFGTGQGYPVNLLATSGINSTGWYDMQFSFSLSAMNALIHGTTQNNWGVPNYTEFTNLFDLFRIKKVVFKMYLNSNSSTVTTPAVSLPVIYSAVTSDDANLVSQTSIQQYETCKSHQFGDKELTWVFKPKPSLLAYNGLTSGYSPTNGWLDTNYSDVPHFGIKFVLDPIFNTSVSTTCGYITCSAQIFYEFKNTK